MSPLLLLVPSAPPGQIVPALVLALASPSDGGRVGRTKISEDNNPLPRDRVIFNFDYFGGVPMLPREVDVRRFSPGIEKTFFDGQMSLEVRVPFASTLSSTVVADGVSNTATEFGNVNLTLKALVFDNDLLHGAAASLCRRPTTCAFASSTAARWRGRRTKRSC